MRVGGLVYAIHLIRHPQAGQAAAAVVVDAGPFTREGFQLSYNHGDAFTFLPWRCRLRREKRAYLLPLYWSKTDVGQALTAVIEADVETRGCGMADQIGFRRGVRHAVAGQQEQEPPQ